MSPHATPPDLATAFPTRSAGPDGPAGRASALREATASQHRDAETRTFIARLMGGELDLAAYTGYLAQLAYVYEALESRRAAPGDPELLSRGGLARSAAIDNDLRALGAAQWRASHPPLPATSEYVDRLREVARGDVALYVAHHYTRYLGDLSGGQAIAALVARHYEATPEQLTFYRFDAIENPVQFKREYRDGLDALDFSAEKDAALIREAQRAFALNAALFDALGAQS